MARTALASGAGTTPAGCPPHVIGRRGACGLSTGADCGAAGSPGRAL